MLTDLQIANLLQSQYNGDQIFDYQNKICEVTFAIKHYPDCSALLFEGTYDLDGWISNFHANLIQVPNLGGVEEGFYNGLPDVLEAIKPELLTNHPLIVCGHSRGAAQANIFAPMLKNAGFTPYLKRVTFASPRPGNAELVAKILTIPGCNYRNYHNEEHQDFVCEVPLHFNFMPYARPQPTILLDVPPLSDDPWLIFARHHLSLYIKGLQTMETICGVS